MPENHDFQSTQSQEYISLWRRILLKILQFTIGFLLSFGSAMSTAGQAYYGTQGLVPQNSSGVLLGIVRVFAAMSAAGTFLSSLGMYAGDIFAFFKYLILPSSQRARLLQWINYIKRAQDCGIDFKDQDKLRSFLQCQLHRDRHARFVQLRLRYRSVGSNSACKKRVIREEKTFLDALSKVMESGSLESQASFSFMQSVFNTKEILSSDSKIDFRTPCRDANLTYFGDSLLVGKDFLSEVVRFKAQHRSLIKGIQDKQAGKVVAVKNKEKDVQDAIFNAICDEASTFFPGDNSLAQRLHYIKQTVRDIEVRFKQSVKGKREPIFATVGGVVGTFGAIANGALAFLGVGVLLNIIDVSGTAITISAGIGGEMWLLLVVSMIAAFAASFMMTRERIKLLFGAMGRYFDKASLVDKPVVFAIAMGMGILAGLGICVLAYYAGQTTFLALIALLAVDLTPLLGIVMIIFAVLCAVSTFFAGCALFSPNLYHNGQGYLAAYQEKGIKGIFLRLFGLEKWIEKQTAGRVGLVICRVIGVVLVLFSMLANLFLTAQSFAIMGMALIGWVLAVLVFIATVSLTGQDVYNLVEDSAQGVVKGTRWIHQQLTKETKKSSGTSLGNTQQDEKKIKKDKKKKEITTQTAKKTLDKGNVSSSKATSSIVPLDSNEHKETKKQVSSGIMMSFNKEE